jgi:hypothetical protein
VVIEYIFTRFGMLHRKKSGNPAQDKWIVDTRAISDPEICFLADAFGGDFECTTSLQIRAKMPNKNVARSEMAFV